MKKFTLFLKINLIIFLLLPSLVQGYNQAERCTNAGNKNVCTLLISDLPDRATNLPANTNVQLVFSAYIAGDQNNSNICPAGKPNIYHIVKHTSGSAYNYVAKGMGESFTYDFNSGSQGQVNNYQAIFFCDTINVASSDNTVVDLRLNNLGSNGVFNVTPFVMTTASADVNLPYIVSTPAAPKAGDDMNFSIRNYPDTYKYINITVNGKIIKTPSVVSYSLKIDESNGFNLNGTNSLSAKLFDANDAEITSKPFSITFSLPPTSTTNSTKTYGCKAVDGIYACASTADAASIAACTTKTEINSCWCGKNEDQVKTQCGANSTTTNSTLPTDKLINPIPTEGLLDTFLGITKGFLAGLAIWAVIAIIFAGFRMVISAGNEEAITQAKKAITWAILGLVVALLSFSMVAIVQNILNVDTTKFDPQLPGTSGYNTEVNNKT